LKFDWFRLRHALRAAGHITYAFFWKGEDDRLASALAGTADERRSPKWFTSYELLRPRAKADFKSELAGAPNAYPLFPRESFLFIILWLTS